MPIQKIAIKNFRSITHVEIEAKQLTAFVGDNDAGKSNILRALNLFFNNTTDLGVAFDFERDFSKFASTPKGKAKEISIELTLTPPANYSSSKEITWRKVWRKEGYYADKEVRAFLDGELFPSRSKISSWLSRIKFKYVPAIKDRDYFKSLMGELYDSLSSTVEHEIKNAAQNFTKEINIHTESILKNIDDRLGIKSSIDLPDDLGAVFQSLAFRSTEGGVALDQRGDGIKVRHIPIVLRFLATQDNHLRDHGSPKFTHVWGYEEPENNLEMRKAFDLASEFLSYLSDVQIFLSTHSPVFYGLHDKAQPNQAILYYTSQLLVSGTQYDSRNGQQWSDIDSKMGLLPLITPYIEKANNEIAKLQVNVDSLKEKLIKNNKPILYVEGPSDKAILEKVVSTFFLEFQSQFTIEYSQNNGGGANWVADMLISHLFSRVTVRACGLFDNDEAGIQARARYTESQKAKDQKITKAFLVPKSTYVISIKSKGIIFHFGIEETLGAGAWLYAKKKNWLEERHDCRKENAIKLSATQSFNDWLDDKALDSTENLIVRNTVNPDKKKDFSKYIGNLSQSDAEKILLPLKTKVHEIIIHLTANKP